MMDSLFTNTAINSSSSAAFSAFSSWLFKTQMSFYNHDLNLPWWFGLCCWNYALGGMALLWMEPKWISTSNFPYRIIALSLIFIQAPLSFMADYLHMEHDSYWHAIDRCLAFPLLLSEVLRFLLQCQHTYKDCIYRLYYSHKNSNRNSNATITNKSTANAMHPLLVLMWGWCLLFAVFSFGQSTKAQAILDRDGFVLWHTAWHLYPVLASINAAIDFYICQGWKRSARQYLYQVEMHLLKKIQ